MLELTVGPYTNGVRKAASALYDGSHGTRCLMNFDHSIEPWEGVNVILRFFLKEKLIRYGSVTGMLFDPSSKFQFKGCNFTCY